jgi:threonine dehydrogenase-like Zn-dependent dehydrogenase
MKALAIFPTAKSIEIISIPEPRLESPNDVLIRPFEVGICGTDRDIVRFEFGTPPPGLDYLVLGHEMLGEVVEVGKNVRDFRPGDLVVPTVRRPCSDSSCVPCQTDQSDMCFTGNFSERGIRSASGYMTEFIVESPAFLTKIPEELRSVGVLVEPLTLTEKALKELEEVQKRLPWECPPGTKGGKYGCRSALVLGAGPVGFLAAISFVKLGMKTYLVSRNNPDDPKIRVLEKAGIHYFCSKTNSPRDLASTIGNIDLIFEAAGSSELSFEYLSILGINGIYLMTGVPGPGNQVTIDGDTLMRRLVLNNQVIVGVVNANIDAFRRAVRSLAVLCEKYSDAMQAMITARAPLENYPSYLMNKQRGEIKTVLTL